MLNYFNLGIVSFLTGVSQFAMDIVLKTTLWLFAFGFVAFLAGQENVSLPGYILVGLVILAIVSWLLSTFVTPFFERRHERELLEAVPGK